MAAVDCSLTAGMVQRVDCLNGQGEAEKMSQGVAHQHWELETPPESIVLAGREDVDLCLAERVPGKSCYMNTASSAIVMYESWMPPPANHGDGDARKDRRGASLLHVWQEGTKQWPEPEKRLRRTWPLDCRCLVLKQLSKKTYPAASTQPWPHNALARPSASIECLRVAGGKRQEELGKGENGFTSCAGGTQHGFPSWA